MQSDRDVFCLCQGGPTQAPPSTGASCYISNGVVTVNGVPSTTQCIARSDVKSLAFPTSASFSFGQLAQARPLTLGLYSSPDCTTGQQDSVQCTELPPTTCTIDSSSTVTVANLAPTVQCVHRGDLLAETGTPSDGTVVFPTPAQECEIQINLFSDAACTVYIQSDRDVFCLCQNPTARGARGTTQ